MYVFMPSLPNLHALYAPLFSSFIPLFLHRCSDAIQVQPPRPSECILAYEHHTPSPLDNVAHWQTEGYRDITLNLGRRLRVFRPIQIQQPKFKVYYDRDIRWKSPMFLPNTNVSFIVEDGTANGAVLNAGTGREKFEISESRLDEDGRPYFVVSSFYSLASVTHVLLVDDCVLFRFTMPGDDAASGSGPCGVYYPALNSHYTHFQHPRRFQLRFDSEAKCLCFFDHDLSPSNPVARFVADGAFPHPRLDFASLPFVLELFKQPAAGQQQVAVQHWQVRVRGSEYSSLIFNGHTLPGRFSGATDRNARIINGEYYSLPDGSNAKHLGIHSTVSAKDAARGGFCARRIFLSHYVEWQPYQRACFPEINHEFWVIEPDSTIPIEPDPPNSPPPIFIDILVPNEQLASTQVFLNKLQASKHLPAVSILEFDSARNCRRKAINLKPKSSNEVFQDSPALVSRFYRRFTFEHDKPHPLFYHGQRLRVHFLNESPVEATVRVMHPSLTEFYCKIDATASIQVQEAQSAFIHFPPFQSIPFPRSVPSLPCKLDSIANPNPVRVITTEADCERFLQGYRAASEQLSNFASQSAFMLVLKQRLLDEMQRHATAAATACGYRVDGIVPLVTRIKTAEYPDLNASVITAAEQVARHAAHAAFAAALSCGLDANDATRAADGDAEDAARWFFKQVHDAVRAAQDLGVDAAAACSSNLVGSAVQAAVRVADGEDSVVQLLTAFAAEPTPNTKEDTARRGAELAAVSEIDATVRVAVDRAFLDGSVFRHISSADDILDPRAIAAAGAAARFAARAAAAPRLAAGVAVDPLMLRAAAQAAADSLLQLYRVAGLHGINVALLQPEIDARAPAAAAVKAAVCQGEMLWAVLSPALQGSLTMREFGAQMRALAQPRRAFATALHTSTASAPAAAASGLQLLRASLLNFCGAAKDFVVRVFRSRVAVATALSESVARVLGADARQVLRFGLCCLVLIYSWCLLGEEEVQADVDCSDSNCSATDALPEHLGLIDESAVAVLLACFVLAVFFEKLCGSVAAIYRFAARVLP